MAAPAAEQIDYLTCGGCQKNFELASINNFVRHKKFDCDEQNTLQGRRSKILLCKSCPQKFDTPWSLLQHAQNVHALQIYLEQGDFSELSIQTVPAAAAASVAAKENHSTPFTSHKTLAFTPKERLPDLNATPVMIIQGANGEKQIVRIEKTPNKVFPEVASKPPEQGLKPVAIKPMSTNTLLCQRVVTDQNHAVRPPAAAPFQSVLAASVSIPKIPNQNPVAASVLQPKLAQQQMVSLNPPQTGPSFLTVLPKANRVPEKPTTTPQAALVPVTQAIPVPVTQAIPVPVTQASPVPPAPRKAVPVTAVDTNPTTVNPPIIPPVQHTLAKAQVDSVNPAKEPDAAAAAAAATTKENTTLDASVSDAAETSVSSREDNNTKDAAAEDEEASLCCDNQDCGVTLMPVTHKELEKCCSAVLPKKRKRHMAINHMPNALRAKRRGDGGDKYSVNVPTASRSFVIDIEHHEDSPRRSPEKNVSSTADSEPPQAASASSETAVAKEEGEGHSKERSVIIQPGASITIPVSLESFRRLVGGRKTGRIPVRFPSSSPMPISMHVAPMNASVSAALTEKDIKPIISAEGQIEKEPETTRETMEEKQEKGTRRGKRRYPTSRPFKCNQCEQGFNQRIHLQKHQSKHTGIKPFQCGQCSYSTVEKSHLKVHIRVHTGEKPFKCTYCEYATAQNSTLKIHLRRHHDHNPASITEMDGEEATMSSSSASSFPAPCSQCSRQCFSEEELQRHAAEEHVMDAVGAGAGEGGGGGGVFSSVVVAAAAAAGKGDVMVEPVPGGNVMELMQVDHPNLDPEGVMTPVFGAIMDQTPSTEQDYENVMPTVAEEEDIMNSNLEIDSDQ